MSNVIYDVQVLMDARLKAIAGLPTISTQNSSAKLETGKPFIKATQRALKNQIETLGGSDIVYQGQYVISIYIAKGVGYKEAHDVAALILPEFRLGTRIVTTDYNLEINDSYFNPMRDEGQFVLLQLVVGWITESGK